MQCTVLRRNGVRSLAARLEPGVFQTLSVIERCKAGSHQIRITASVAVSASVAPGWAEEEEEEEENILVQGLSPSRQRACVDGAGFFLYCCQYHQRDQYSYEDT